MALSRRMGRTCPARLTCPAGAEITLEPGEAGVPAGSGLGHPGGRLEERLGPDAVASLATRSRA
jgi:hypothetical protein